MQNEIPQYLEALEQNASHLISALLNTKMVNQVASEAFTFHFTDKQSFVFQKYYLRIVANQKGFLAQPDFFRQFKQMYALQGIDGPYLDTLEREKKTILQFLKANELSKLYFNYFAAASLQHGKGQIKKNLGSFFAKLVHTFIPDKYCALDNPIKQHLGQGRESFFVAFITISNAYRKWASDNPVLMRQIRDELEANITGKRFSAKMTDLKLLDMIFWHQANIVK